jgi:hypothetical protein
MTKKRPEALPLALDVIRAQDEHVLPAASCRGAPRHKTGVLLSTLNLIFPNYPLVPVILALDAVLKYVSRFRELSDDLVAAFFLTIVA